MKKYFYILILCLFFLGHNAHAVQLNTKGITTYDKKITVWVDFDIPPGKTKTELYVSVYTGNTKMLGPKTFYGTNSPQAFDLDTSTLWDNTTYTLKISDNVPQSDTISTDFLNKNSAGNGVTKAGTGDWYYTTSFDLGAYDTDLHNSFFRFTTEALCKAEFNKTLDRGLEDGKTYTITDCFKATTSGTVPTKTEFNSKLKALSTFSEHYWYTTKFGGTLWQKYGEYKDKTTCESKKTSWLKISTNEKLEKDCFVSTTPPVEPNADAVNIEGQQNHVFDDDYTLLAPIGNLTKIDKETKLGDYLNVIFKIAIGLCGALAVIMIVINGVVWMGSDSVFGHTEAKGRIMNSIGGLILALGAYMLLNTINPDFVGGNISVAPVTLELKNMVDTLPPAKDDSGNKCVYSNTVTFPGKASVVSGGSISQGIHECNAVDIGSKAAQGSVIAVNTIADGTVMQATNGCKDGDTKCGGGFGNYVKIKHANGAWTLYAHGTKTVVKTGDTVKSGQKIMEMGNTGLSTGRHLHLRVMYAKNPYESLKFGTAVQ